MSNKHKSHKKHNSHKEHKSHKKSSDKILKKKVKVHIVKKCNQNELDSSIFESGSVVGRELNYKFDNKKVNPNINSYPLANLGYNFPNPTYSTQVIRRPDDNKYFNNYKYNYNVQVNKPSLTYGNYITQLSQKNMSEQERKYYEKLNQKYFYYNGTYEVVDNKPIVLALQSNLTYPLYSSGPIVGETNGQFGYTQQSYTTMPVPMVNSNDLIGLNSGNIQTYANSPAYYGIQSKTLPGQNQIPNLTKNTYSGNNIPNNNNQFFY
jgi:hypothetical protein